MAGITVVRAADTTPTDGHPVAGHAVHGGGKYRLLSPADYSLWLVAATVDAGAVIELPEQHGEEAIYVLGGELLAGDVGCRSRGAVVIEAGARPALRASEPTRLVHMGSWVPVLHAAPGSLVHVVGARGIYAARDDARDSRYYADSTCPTCNLTLLYTSRFSRYVSPAHSHSTDELIHVLWGELHLGNQVVGPGDTLAVAADRRYGFRSGEEGFGFLNYRREASQQVVERGSAPRQEGGLVNGFEAVLDVVDIQTVQQAESI